MEKMKVSQVAKILGISPTAVYKKFKTSSELFQNHITKEKGVTYIDAEGFELVKNSMQKPMSEPVSPGSELVETLQKELDRKQGIIESLIAQNEAQRQRTDTILMKLTNDISSLQKALEFKKTEIPASIPVSDGPINTKKETPFPRSTPKVSPLVVKLPPVQRQLSTWESITLFFDDALGFIGLGG